MKLETVWLVRDPAPDSVFEDVCWEQEVERLGDYVFGSGQFVWARERTAMYTRRQEAEADARARLAKVKENGR
jgi:hypothetical protein